jgi:hypothetical protein
MNSKTIPAPLGQFGPEWMILVKKARDQKIDNPEHYADAVLRMKEKERALISARPTLIKIDRKSVENVEKPKVKLVVDSSCRCKATTLSGKKCTFKATHDGFCNKHKI